MKELDQPRPAGSEAEKMAAGYLAQTVRNAGGEAREEAFDFDDQAVQAEFEILSPWMEKISVTGYELPDAEKAESAEVTAPLLYAENGSGLALEKVENAEVTAPLLYAENGSSLALEDAAGKIVLLNSPVDAAMHGKLRDAGAAGFLVITGTPAGEGAERVPRRLRLRKVREKALPGVTVHFLDAMALIERMACGEVTAKLTVVRRMGKICSQNVCASVPVILGSEGVKSCSTAELSGDNSAQARSGAVPGFGKLPGYVLLTAHYDSVPEGPGAYDNLAACSVLTALFREFQSRPARREIRFVWFGSEEKGLKGSEAYVRKHMAEMKDCIAAVNLDLAGQAIGSDVLGVTGSDSFVGEIEKIVRENHWNAEVRQSVWSSDSNCLAAAGVPALTYDRDGFGMHTSFDRQEYLSAWELSRETMYISRLVRSLADDPEPGYSRELPEAMDAELKSLREKILS